MKKLSILILICFTQCISSPNTTSDSKLKVSKTKNTGEINNQSNKSGSPVLEVTKSTDLQEEITKVDNTIYNIDDIEVAPQFPGGINKFYKFMDFNTKYPDEELNIKGEVFVTFVVEKDGSLTDIEVLSDAGYGTGTEVIRVLKKCPNWNPGKLNDEDVRVFYSATIPIK